MNVNKKIISASSAISNFFNPLNSMLIYFLYYSYRHYNWEQMWDRLLPLVCLVLLPTLAWIVINVYAGKYSNFDVSNRNQRKSLYVFLGISISVYLIYMYYANGLLDLTVALVLFLVLIMQLSNFFIKSSMHVAFNVFVSALFFSQDTLMGFLWLIITIMVAVSRVVLKRHSVQEVAMGATIASMCSLLYFYCLEHYPAYFF